jgi:hypothetical protein
MVFSRGCHISNLYFMADTNKKPAENPDLEIQEIIQGL